MIYICLLLSHKNLLIRGNLTPRAGRWVSSLLLKYGLIILRRIFAFALLFGILGGSLKRESDWIGKSCTNNFFPEGDLTRMFVYETNIFEDEGEFSFDTKTIYSTRCSLRSIKPSVGLSEKYIIGRTIFVRLRKKDNTPVVSAPSCLQQFSFESFFTRKNSTSQQMTSWLRLGLDSSVSTPFRNSK